MTPAPSHAVITWRKVWLLFSAIWVVVAALQVFSILAFSEETDKVWRPLLAGVAVPAVLYALGWAWAWFRQRKK